MEDAPACDWCKREFTPSGSAKRRRPRGRVCAACAKHIYHNYSAECGTADGRQAKLQEINENPEVQMAWTQSAVAEFQVHGNSHDRLTPKKRKTCSDSDDTDMERDDADGQDTISRKRRRVHVGEKCVAVFWPMKMYKADISSKVAKNKIKIWDGEKGVYADPSHGNPSGTTKIMERVEDVVERKDILASTKHLTQKKLKDLWDQAESTNKMKAKKVKGKKPGSGSTIALSFPNRDGGGYDEDEEAEKVRTVLDDIWGGGLFEDTAGKYDDDEDDYSSRGHPSSSKPKRSSGKKVERVEDALEVGQDAPVDETKAVADVAETGDDFDIAVEIVQSEKILQDVRALLQKAASQEVRNIKKKEVDTMLAALKSRMSDDLITFVYVWSDGMQLPKNLATAECDLAELAAVFTAMPLQKPTDPAFEDSIAGLRVMLDSCGEPPKFHVDTLYQLAVEMALANILHNKGVAQYLDRLDPRSDEIAGAKGIHYSIMWVPEGSRAQFQKHMLRKMIAPMLLSGGSQEKCCEGCKAVSGLEDAFFLDPQVRAMKSSFAILADPSLAKSVGCMDEAMATLKGGDSFVHEEISFGATARVLMGICQGHRAQLLRDVESARTLSKVSLPPDIDFDTMSPGVIELPNKDAWAMARDRVKKITATSSQHFRKSDEYLAISAKFQAATDALHARCEQGHKGYLVDMAAVCKQILNAASVLQDGKDMADKYAESLPTYETIGIANLLLGDDADAKTKYEQRADKLKGHMHTIYRTVAEIIEKDNPFEYSRATLHEFFAFCDVVTQAYAEVHDIQEPVAEIKSSILTKAEAKLVESVPTSWHGFLYSIVTETVLQGSLKVLVADDKFGDMCKDWLVMFQPYVAHGKQFKIGEVDFDSALVCLSPELYNIVQNADTIKGKSWLAKVEYVRDVQQSTKQFRQTSANVWLKDGAEEDTHVIKVLSDELLRRLEDSKMALFNECERDCLSTLDIALAMMEDEALASCVAPDTFGMEVAAKVVEFSKTAKMKALAAGVCESLEKCKLYNKVAEFLEKEKDGDISSKRVKLVTQFDSLTILQTLGRPKGSTETMASLAVRCWQKVAIDKVPTCLQVALERNIPTQILKQLRTAATGAST